LLLLLLLLLWRSRCTGHDSFGRRHLRRDHSTSQRQRVFGLAMHTTYCCCYCCSHIPDQDDTSDEGIHPKKDEDDDFGTTLSVVPIVVCCCCCWCWCWCCCGEVTIGSAIPSFPMKTTTHISKVNPEKKTTMLVNGPCWFLLLLLLLLLLFLLWWRIGDDRLIPATHSLLRKDENADKMTEDEWIHCEKQQQGILIWWSRYSSYSFVFLLFLFVFLFLCYDSDILIAACDVVELVVVVVVVEGALCRG